MDKQLQKHGSTWLRMARESWAGFSCLMSKKDRQTADKGCHFCNTTGERQGYIEHSVVTKSVAKTSKAFPAQCPEGQKAHTGSWLK